MHWGKRKFLIFALCALALALLLGFVMTLDTGSGVLRRSVATKSRAETTIVDQAPFRTAISLQPIANTADEQELATQAVHVADREVDLAFASALRRAKETPPPQTKETVEINNRIRKLQARLQSMQTEVASLTQLSQKPGKKDPAAIQQRVEITKAQVGLLQDALDDAKQELVRAGGDPEASIQQELEQHESLQQHGSAGASAGLPGKPQVFEAEGNLVSQFRVWLALRENRRRLLQARQQAGDAVSLLTKKHQALERGMGDNFALGDSVSDNNSSPESGPADAGQHAARLAKLNTLSQNTKTLTAYDKRIDLEKQLAAIYGDWMGIVDAQRRLVLHAILRSILWVVLALLGLVIVEGSIEHFYFRLGPDRRRMGAMRLALRFVAELIGVLIILLVVFGRPSQLSTVLALAGAGLTVALKDFIVAFFGWFILMGRNGIRVGDWVEINGIGGEVLDIGLLRTILLETGNWNDAGHPTGRRVSFVNSFAVEGHYFNFTTTGQWLWDQLDILIPAGEDPYELTNSVLKLVTEQTESEAALAEQEWQRVTHTSAVQRFSATPAIEVRPTNLGVNLVVRYIVHAHDRHEVRTRLYQAIVELLHARTVAKAGAEGTVAS
ncbi:MAG TPA: mechanosensitive ion channel domain-containing protein [Candidatus Binatia bacterium]|nr:mechanosensitive ion channel domain-containing protein [Candidatus Binatia bacterium]